jgi:hypothetical protein
MQVPLDILEEIGQTYGPTRKLHQALATLVSATVENLGKPRGESQVSGIPLETGVHALHPPSVQVPLRLDANLQLGSSNNSETPPTSGPAQPRALEVAHTSAMWNTPETGFVGNGLPPLQSAATHGIEHVASHLDVTQLSPSTTSFENSLLWAPSLDWSGGWDDFLNAIAM